MKNVTSGHLRVEFNDTWNYWSSSFLAAEWRLLTSIAKSYRWSILKLKIYTRFLDGDEAEPTFETCLVLSVLDLIWYLETNLRTFWCVSFELIRELKYQNIFDHFKNRVTAKQIQIHHVWYNKSLPALSFPFSFRQNCCQVHTFTCRPHLAVNRWSSCSHCQSKKSQFSWLTRYKSLKDT